MREFLVDVLGIDVSKGDFHACLIQGQRRSKKAAVHGRPRICKTGNASLRRDPYMPALVAVRHNAIFRAFAERLRARGKPAKVVVVAVMRKLLLLAYMPLKRDLAPQPVT